MTNRKSSQLRVCLQRLTLLFLLTTPLHGIAQNCRPIRYTDALFAVSTTYSIEYQQSIPYGYFISYPYYLDLYRPMGDTLQHRPLILFLFGGAFTTGDRSWPPAPEMCTYWAERGFVSVAMDYRLGFNTLSTGSAERAVYRSIQDLQAALRYLAEQRDFYGIDTGNIIIAGNSAGAITALHNAFMDQDQAPASYTGFGFTVDAPDLGGLYSSGNNFFGQREVKTHGLIADWGGITDTTFLGDRADDCIPTCFFHGSEDNLVYIDEGNPFSYPVFPYIYGSKPMNQRMNHTFIPHMFEVFDGAGHEPELLESTYLDTILTFSGQFMLENVLCPKYTGFTGDQVVLSGQSTSYSVQTTEPVRLVCIETNNGQVTGQSGQQFTIQWQTAGLDTIRVYAYNAIDANRMLEIPVTITTSTVVIEANDAPASDELQVYLQPGNHSLSVQTAGLPCRLALYDYLGRLIASGQTDRSSYYTLQLPELSTGLYIVRVEEQGSERVTTKKVYLP